jgi:GMP synthase (glutamine-hydrolysing)
MEEKILILDFGSQYTQLIARRLRELGVYCEIHPYHFSPNWTKDIKGVILSGSPASVSQPNAPLPSFSLPEVAVPVLGICYGAQWMVHALGGTLGTSHHREYGAAMLQPALAHPFWGSEELAPSQVWMSHGDSVLALPEGFEVLGSTSDLPLAAFAHREKPWIGVQFHPEVFHTTHGAKWLGQFVHQICDMQPTWTPESFRSMVVKQIQTQVGQGHLVMAMSGGVDSTVAAVLIHEAIGNQFHGIFVDHGLMRSGEREEVMELYRQLGLPVTCMDASALFFSRLNGITDPEQKRKIIGAAFIDVFQKEAQYQPNIQFLGQGTIYPDVIESVSVNGPSVTIKSHHNVGGLPEHLHLKVVEPLRLLFKDEVRRLGKALDIPEHFLARHPFPGPGLAIRILGEVTEEKVEALQQADAIFIQHLKASGWYNQVWQAGAMLLPVKSVGVMGDARTYAFTLALRAVTSTDGMTAAVAELPHALLAKMSNDIINKVPMINRVVYDISSKPPATIEWE